MTASVDFYLDFSCPWSYLALVRLRDATDRNAATINFKPISVHLLLATENPDLQASRLSAHPLKATWQKQDLQLWARFWGLRLNLHSNWPFDAIVPASAMIAAISAGKGFVYAMQLFREHFGAGADITNSVILGQIATTVGMDCDELLRQIDSTKLQKQVETNTLELIRRGGFGTPSMFIGNQLFFGNDRIPLVEWMLGPISDDEFVMPGQHSKA
jgi:2-hydroxychromene-2-carboxylate isomerase